MYLWAFPIKEEPYKTFYQNSRFFKHVPLTQCARIRVPVVSIKIKKFKDLFRAASMSPKILVSAAPGSPYGQYLVPFCQIWAKSNFQIMI